MMSSVSRCSTESSGKDSEKPVRNVSFRFGDGRVDFSQTSQTSVDSFCGTKSATYSSAGEKQEYDYIGDLNDLKYGQSRIEAAISNIEEDIAALPDVLQAALSRVGANYCVSTGSAVGLGGPLQALKSSAIPAPPSERLETIEEHLQSKPDSLKSDMGKQQPKPQRSGTLSLHLRDVWVDVGEDVQAKVCDMEEQGASIDIAIQKHAKSSHKKKAKKSQELTGHFFSSGSSQKNLALDHHDKHWFFPNSAQVTCVMHPMGRRRLLWNFPCFILIAYDIVFVPLQAFDIDETGVLFAIEYVSTVFWSLDVIINFQTGYFTGLMVEMRLLQTIKHYATSWFVLDLFIVALDWLGRYVGTMSDASIVRSARVFRVLRCLRLLRLVKMRSWWISMEDQLNSNGMRLLSRIIKLVIVLGIVVHCVTCVWYLIGRSTSNGWTTYATSSETLSAWHYGIEFTFWYFSSARWTLAQINGRTDMDERRNIRELMFTCFVAVAIAVVFMALFLSTITTTMLELSVVAQEHSELNRIVNRYLQHYQISSTLTTQVKQLKRRAEGKEIEHESVVSNALPKQLQNDLLLEARGPILTRHLFFFELNFGFPRIIRHVCYEAVRLVVSHHQMVIFDKGDAFNDMLFVDTGLLMYVLLEQNADDTLWEMAKEKTSKSLRESDTVDACLSFTDGHDWPQVTQLKADMWISEVCIWAQWYARGSLNTVAYSVLLALDAKKFAEVLGEYKGSDAYAIAVMYARSFIVAVQQTSYVSDIQRFDVCFS